MTWLVAREDARAETKSAALTRKFENLTSRSTSRLRPATSMIWRPTRRVNMESIRPSAPATGVKYCSSSLETTGALSCVCTDCTFSLRKLSASIHTVPR